MRRTWTFDRGKHKFVYEDDAFRFTDAPDYADGGHTRRAGFEGGALTVKLGGIDASDVAGMSGGWSKTFTLEEAQPLRLTLRYRIEQGPDYERGEYSEVRVAVDGEAFGTRGNDHVARLRGDGNGGEDRSTGWKTVTIELGELGPGRHTLTLGGYGNGKTSASERSKFLFDDVTVATARARLGEFEARVLELTNEFRAEHDMPALRSDARLDAAAEDWSRDMARGDFFRHSTPEQVEQFGYEWSNWGENIAAGYRTPEEVVDGWINSPGHRRNLLSENFEEIGIGYYFRADDGGDAPYGHYWTQAFGTELA